MSFLHQNVNDVHRTEVNNKERKKKRKEMSHTLYNIYLVRKTKLDHQKKRENVGFTIKCVRAYQGCIKLHVSLPFTLSLSWGRGWGGLYNMFLWRNKKNINTFWMKKKGTLF